MFKHRSFRKQRRQVVYTRKFLDNSSPSIRKQSTFGVLEGAKRPERKLPFLSSSGLAKKLAMYKQQIAQAAKPKTEFQGMFSRSIGVLKMANRMESYTPYANSVVVPPKRSYEVLRLPKQKKVVIPDALTPWGF